MLIEQPAGACRIEMQTGVDKCLCRRDGRQRARGTVSLEESGHVHEAATQRFFVQRWLWIPSLPRPRRFCVGGRAMVERPLCEAQVVEFDSDVEDIAGAGAIATHI